MQYQYIDIAGKNPYTDTFFTITPDDHPRAPFDLILPDCTPGLMFIESGDIRRNNGPENSLLVPGTIYLFGQKTKAVEYHFAPTNLRAFGVKLKPSSVFSLFGINANEMTDQLVQLDELVGPMDKQLECFYADSTSPKCQLELILSCLKPHANIANAPLLEALLSEIHQTKGEITIYSLAKKHGIGYKKMERLFRRHVGLTPKCYARIVRFYLCILNGLKYRQPRLTDIGYQSGFFDQTHFIKESKKMTGRTPSKLFGAHQPSLEEQQISYLESRGY